MRSKKLFKIIGITVLSCLTIAVGAGVFAYVKLNQTVDSKDVNDLLVNARPAKSVELSSSDDPYDGRALNYVLIGSDSRGGDNAAIDGADVEGMRSDTTIIAHVSKNRDRVDMVSIPRDSIVTIPSCKLSSGTILSEKINAQFNSAFALGDDISSAVACTIATIEENTGIYIDGYIVVDFSSFEKVIDSLGGVPFDVPYDMVSKKANLNLEKGYQTLNGEQALAYARARTFEVGGGDGSDLSRITRQQDLLKAVASKILSSDTLGNPVKTYSVMSNVIQSLTVSPDLGSVNKMAGFAYSLRNISVNDINFYTVPNEPWSVNRNRVIWTDDADELWQSLINDVTYDTGKS